MGRWEPDAEGRFRAAAMELFAERGYELTTVADIAERAGLTRRTFFRYFADKREVLFNGGARLQTLMTDAMAAVPAQASPMEGISAALHATAEFFDGNRDFARQRQAVIATHTDLHERELMKLATLAVALTDALRSRGVPEPDASLAGETGIAVFRVSFASWVAAGEERTFAEILEAALARLKALSLGKT